mmetsp:Transcript_8958/g.24088  ORF Transcript_8958/g.24088 Transcript_8958/m.24088 type:complete len:536 (-) Transcript_8958:54-1661(-)
MTACISAFAVMSLRGDVLVSRDFLSDVPRTALETFYRFYTFWQQENANNVEFQDQPQAPPCFDVDGVHYFSVSKSGLIFVATSRSNASPSFVLEFLTRVSRAMADFLGTLNEESVRRNMVLVYELVDEMVDFGYPQLTSTEALKAYVLSQAKAPSQGSSGAASANGMSGRPGARGAGMPSGGPSQGAAALAAATGVSNTDGVGGAAAAAGGSGRDEIFVDVVEKISLTFNASGSLVASDIDGAIQVRSFLNGKPEIRLALNEDLSIGGRGGSPFANDYAYAAGRSPMVMLDDANFHEAVNLDHFERERILTLNHLPEGEFTLMNYRCSNTTMIRPPFQMSVSVSEASSYSVDLIVTLKGDFPGKLHATNVCVQIPVPKAVSKATARPIPLETIGGGGGGGGGGGAMQGLGALFGRRSAADVAEANLKSVVASTGQTTDYSDREKVVTWSFAKLPGDTEHRLLVRLSLSNNAQTNVRRECGPVNLTFTIPMYSTSKLGVRSLHVSRPSAGLGKPDAPAPYRWIRYLTKATSYVFRL